MRQEPAVGHGRELKASCEIEHDDSEKAGDGEQIIRGSDLDMAW